ncbi:hypothetical protein DTO96_102227 [Ephemeroptericola cinctiostellae]|uniref:DUF1304 domain-containing protein n=1 Tax=Ephemeroptericola cinctiostellae TaxID=2268024 RepID=A0A345DDN5_9BURK|nr:DUF1304 domain-containing protein [Ephemeroptericola cinctiostellae]AXF86473.1 hypothetical protein DTO96_102227 [Ephemeroptericola cinctiostellae]
MSTIAYVFIAFIACLHLYILVLEMFWWNTPKGQKAFKLTPEFTAQTTALAANQGLYNGFLAAGLFWSLLHPNPAFAKQIALFFLCCVAIAGVYGALTAAKKILYIQTVPAVLGISAVLLS